MRLGVNVTHLDPGIAVDASGAARLGYGWPWCQKDFGPTPSVSRGLVGRPYQRNPAVGHLPAAGSYAGRDGDDGRHPRDLVR